MAIRKVINLQAYRAKDMSLAEMASALMRQTLMTAAEVKDYHNSVKARTDCPVGVSPEAWEQEKAISLRTRLNLRQEAVAFSDPKALHDFWIPYTLHSSIHAFRDEMQKTYNPNKGILLAFADGVIDKLEEKLVDGIFRGFDMTPPAEFKSQLATHFFDLARRSRSLPLDGCELLCVNKPPAPPQVRLFLP